ncbi:hypothetical protein [uncultured Methanoregula sp.]|uniref:hypothetical protein n=1 Tax=uncultured Methanoregula sp. TaxID=1005933 RepID=UPI002AAA7971|nr:hypothetical protein [uncultured Methanoregula sp.]
MKLPGSSSDFSVCSTNGEQLAGDLPEYNELAHQLDKKRILFYCEAEEKAILLGTRLIVRIVGGREERAIFIKRYSLPEFSLQGDFINRFYNDARAQVENLKQIHYQVLGLLKEGDLPVREQGIALSALPAITGKVLIREPVKLKIVDLSLSFGAAKKIIEAFSRKNIPGYKISIAQYPFDEDVLISPNVTGMDLEILDNGEEKIQPGFQKSQLLFQAVSAIYDKQRNALKNIDFRDKSSFSRVIKNYLIDSDILDTIIRTDPATTQDILDLFPGDPAQLYRISGKIFRYNKTLQGISKESLALIARHIIEQAKNLSVEDRELLKACYTGGDDGLKDSVLPFLVSLERPEDYFLQDLVDSCIRTQNLPLLRSVITNPSFNDRKLQVVTGGVHLHRMEQDLVLDFIEDIFDSGFEKEKKGNPVYLSILRQYQERQFSIKKMNQVQDMYGRPLMPSPGPSATTTQPGNRNTTLLLIVLVVCIAIAGLILFWFTGLAGTGMSGSPAANETGNQTTPALNETVSPAITPAQGIQNLSRDPVYGKSMR